MLEWLFEANYFGNSLYQIGLFFAAIVLSVVIGKTVYYLIKTKARQAAKKSKTRIDDLLLQTVEKPLIFFLIIIGLGFGARFLSIPVELLSLVQTISNILITIGAAWIAINLADAIIKLYLMPLVEATDSKLDDQLIPLVSRTIKLLIVALALMIIFSSFGYDLTAVLAGLGIGGLAIAFAAQETISDMFGGLNIFVSKPFMIGDWVDIEGTVGQVEKVSVRHTTIRNLDKRKVIFPNSKISKGIIVNISSAPARKIMMDLGLTYETPANKVKKAIEIVKGIIDKHPDCEKDPEPVVQLSEFKDSSLNLLVIYYADNGKWFGARHEINMAIKEAFDKAKIDFAYPTQMIYTAKA